MATIHPTTSTTTDLHEAVKDAKDHTDPRVYQEKNVEKTPACFLKPRKLAGRKRTMIKLEKKRRRGGEDTKKPPQFVFDDGAMSFAASSIGNESVASLIRVPPFSDNKSLLGGSKASSSSRFSRGSRKNYYGLSADDAASVGSSSSSTRASYKKSQDDPPEAVLPRGLQFGAPMIMNRSQAAAEEGLLLGRVQEDTDLILKHDDDDDENERLVTSAGPRDLDTYINRLGDTRFLGDEEHGSGAMLYRKPEHLQSAAQGHQSKASLGSDSSSQNRSTNEFLNWYIKVEQDIKRKRVVAGGICLFLTAFVVTMIVVFTSSSSSGGSSSGGGGGDALSSSGDRSIPARPAPPIPPVFDDKTVPLLPPSGEVWTDDSLKAMLEAFSHSNLLEDGTNTTPQGKAFAWLQKSNLADMHGTRVGQRYALAVLYYATTHERAWSVETGWLSSDHECTWHGVGCGGGNNNNNNQEGTGRRRDLQEGLAETVTYINLSNNNLYGSLPTEVKYLDQLQHLMLTENLIKGSIPADWLREMSELKTLYLDENFLDGIIPDEFNNMKSLKHLDLSGNTFEGSIPNSLEFTTELVDARFSGNSLQGEVPDAFRDLSKLTVFLAGSNDLEGSIPASLGRSTSLVTLFLQENELQGGVPDFASKILQHLHLDSNALTGKLPSFDSPSSLEELRLEGNQLTGGVPVALGDYTNLKLLWLNNNELTSTVPHELGRLEHLTSLKIDRNNLEGSIPASVCALKAEHKLGTLRATCGGSNPNLKCSCCDSC